MVRYVSRKGSQISFFVELGELPGSWRAAALVVSATKSNGCRKVATTSPSLQVQFESTKLREKGLEPLDPRIKGADPVAQEADGRGADPRCFPIASPESNRP
jgi:hypothetical protein